MPENAFASSVIQLLREVYKIQRFIVIGFPLARKELLNLPWRTSTLFQYQMKAEFEAFELATEVDFNSQNLLIKTLRTDWVFIPENRGMMYFKVRPIK